MSCGSNIFNETESDIVYECANNGGGLGIFSGEAITPTETTFNFKSLLAGSNINLVDTADDITINNTQTEVNGIINMGTGSGLVLVDVLGSDVRARTIAGNLGIDINTSGDIVQLEDDSIQTLATSTQYNYGQGVSINLASSYSSPSGVSSNTGQPMDPFSGIVSPTGLATIYYTPSARMTEPAFYQYTTTANNLTTKAMMTKIYPNLSAANDQVNNYLLASGINGLLYQISPSIVAENLMTDYNGNPLSLTNVACIAMDIADNVLFYTTSTTPNVVRYYDFAIGIDLALITASSVSGWSGGNISDLAFEQNTRTLYIQSDLANSRLLCTTILPYDRYGFGTFRYTSVIPYGATISAVGSTNTSITIDEIGNVFIAYIPAAANTTVAFTVLPGSGTVATLSSTIPEANTSPKRLVTSADGRIFCYSDTANAFYTSAVGNSIGSGMALVKNLTRAYRSFTRSCYGIIAI